ncbi:MAG: PIN domain-containing protein [Terracidiphilus sp.]|jgi:predicted nucleic acid-binding protein
MRRVVLDTNVIVSAGLKLGSVPYRVVMDWVLAGQAQAAICPAVVREYREVLWRPKFTRHGFPPEWIEDLLALSLQLPDPVPWPHLLPDPSDAVFLALAKAAGAWLVTGNLKHFPKTARRGVTVIAPGEYLERLGEGVRGFEGT